MSEETRADGNEGDFRRVAPGTRIANRYRLVNELGRGGMAQVFEAVDETLDRRVAVKVLHPHLAADDTFVTRFRQEAIAAARLTHPGIVGVYDTCSDGTHEAIVMELLDARTLREVLDERGTLDTESVRRIGLRLLDALEAAHNSGLVHRDIKPSNILLCTDGRVKIADFGIAKAEDHTEITREGSLVGTASYLSPEQLEGASVDRRSDLYSLGLVLYECLVGRIPFEGDSGAAVALARLHVDPVDPRGYRADVPPSLATTVMRALRRDPAERFGDAAEFKAALLETAPPQPIAVAPVNPVALDDALEPADAAGFGRSERRWLVPALGIIMVAGALVVAGTLLRQNTSDSVIPSSTLPPAAEAPKVAGVSTYDPSGTGDPGENDILAPAAVDGNPETAWRTENYDTRTFFPGKAGVGLLVHLDRPSLIDSVTINSSANGWSGEIHLVTSGEFPNPDAGPPAATLTDVRGELKVPMGGVRADGLLLWITDLGDGQGSYRVEINEITVEGTAVG